MKRILAALCVEVIVLAGNVTHATVLTFTATNNVGQRAGDGFNNINGPTGWLNNNTGSPDTSPAPLFLDPSSGGFSDYGARVTNATQAGMGPGGVYTYYYGAAGGATPNIVASYPAGAGTIPTTVSIGGNTFTTNMPEGMYLSELNFYPNYSVAQSYFGDNGIHRLITLSADPNQAVWLQSFAIENDYSYAYPGNIQYVDVVRIDGPNQETLLWSTNNPGSSALIEMTFNQANFGNALTGQVLAIDFQPAGGLAYGYGLTDVQFAQIPEPSLLALFVAAGVLVWRSRGNAQS